MNPIELRDHALWATKVFRPDRAGAMRRDDARNLLRRTLTSFARRHSLRIHAWAVQPSRIHLMLQIPADITLTPVLASMFAYYTRRFNTRYGKSGPIFRTKFLRRVIIGPLAITDAIRRIHRLPASDDIVVGPGEEPWSSAECYELGAPPDGIVTPYRPSNVRRATVLDQLDG